MILLSILASRYFSATLLGGTILLVSLVVVYFAYWRRHERFPGHSSGKAPERYSRPFPDRPDAEDKD